MEERRNSEYYAEKLAPSLVLLAGMSAPQNQSLAQVPCWVDGANNRPKIRKKEILSFIELMRLLKRILPGRCEK